MAYDRDRIYNEAVKICEDESLYFIEDIIALLPISKQSFYTFFPIGSDELDAIKSLLEENRVRAKSEMRSKWRKSDAPALQIALMKLIATDDEAHRLNGTKTVNENINTEAKILTNDPFTLDEGDNGSS